MTDPAHPIESDEDDPNDVELAWAEEIERRRRELNDGSVTPLSKDEFLRRLRQSE